jgi:MFS transporter, DHA1 family, tetracycline resistance protein
MLMHIYIVAFAGMAFTIGLPLGGMLGARRGYRFPVMISIGLCAFNFLFTSLIMPESLPQHKRKPTVDLKQANPLGAVK